MSSTDNTGPDTTDGTTPQTASEKDRSIEELLAQLEELQAENQRLRREYAATQRSQYRRTAMGLYLLGGLSLSAAILFSNSSDVLFALGATGLFAGLFTYYLTPEQFVAASVSERIAAAYTATLNAVITNLGLQDTRVYVPLPDGHNTQVADVLLFVPQAATYELPPSPEPGIATPENRRARGFLSVPTGGTLLREFEQTINRPLPTEIDRLAEQLADGITEQFELADTVRTESTTVTDGDVNNTLSSGSETTTDQNESIRIAVVVEEPTLEPGAIGDPIMSFVGAGIAKALAVPVEVTEYATTDEDKHRFTLEWDELPQKDTGSR